MFKVLQYHTHTIYSLSYTENLEPLKFKTYGTDYNVE